MADKLKNYVMTFESFQSIERTILSEQAQAQVSEEDRQINEMVSHLRKLPAFANVDENSLIDAAKGLVQKAGAVVGILSDADKTKFDQVAKKTELNPEEAQALVTDGTFKKAVDQTKAMNNVSKVIAHRDLVLADPAKYAIDILSTIQAADKFAKGLTPGKGKMEAFLERGQDGQIHLAYKGLIAQSAKF